MVAGTYVGKRHRIKTGQKLDKFSLTNFRLMYLNPNTYKLNITYEMKQLENINAEIFFACEENNLKIFFHTMTTS